MPNVDLDVSPEATTPNPNLVAIRDFEGVDLKPKFDELSYEQLIYIELASRGFTCQATAKAVMNSVGIVKNRRMHTLHQIGAYNMPHAVRLASYAGMFDEEKLEKLPDYTEEIADNAPQLRLASLGYSIREEAEISDLPHTTISGRRARTIDMLRARNLPHAVRILFHIELLPE